MFYHIIIFFKWHVLLLHFCCIVSAPRHMLYDSFVKSYVYYVWEWLSYFPSRTYLPYFLFIKCHVCGHFSSSLIWYFNIVFYNGSFEFHYSPLPDCRKVARLGCKVMHNSKNVHFGGDIVVGRGRKIFRLQQVRESGYFIDEGLFWNYGPLGPCKEHL